MNSTGVVEECLQSDAGHPIRVPGHSRRHAWTPALHCTHDFMVSSVHGSPAPV